MYITDLSLHDTPYMYGVYLTGKGVCITTPLPVRYGTEYRLYQNLTTERVPASCPPLLHRVNLAGKGVRFYPDPSLYDTSSYTECILQGGYRYLRPGPPRSKLSASVTPGGA